MVAAIPVTKALQDAFFAAGLGFLLCLLYSCLRLVLGHSKAALLLCDVLILPVAALLLRSAAVSRFFSGLPRWYDLLTCVCAFFFCRSALAPALEKMRAFLVSWVQFPGRLVQKRLLKPVCGKIQAWQKAHREKTRARKQEKSKQQRKKRLQNTGRVLYNSK